MCETALKPGLAGEPLRSPAGLTYAAHTVFGDVANAGEINLALSEFAGRQPVANALDSQSAV